MSSQLTRTSTSPTLAGDYLRFGGATILKFSMMDGLEGRALATLFELTLRDPLTRLYNRRYFDDHLRSEYSFARRHGTLLALCSIDIDHFKAINDSGGHQIGDAVLKLVATSIERMMLPEDVLARFSSVDVETKDRGQPMHDLLAAWGELVKALALTVIKGVPGGFARVRVRDAILDETCSTIYARLGTAWRKAPYAWRCCRNDSSAIPTAGQPAFVALLSTACSCPPSRAGQSPTPRSLSGAASLTLAVLGSAHLGRGALHLLTGHPDAPIHRRLGQRRRCEGRRTSAQRRLARGPVPLVASKDWARAAEAAR